MTPEQLRAAGRALYGDDFEDGLAYALHLAPGTLRRMLAGREPVDEPLRRELDRLLAAAGRGGPRPPPRRAAARPPVPAARGGHPRPPAAAAEGPGPPGDGGGARPGGGGGPR